MNKYRITAEQLIDKLGIAIEQCLAIIEQDIASDITEDKMHNVLKGKRMAAEDAIFYAKEIDRLEVELSGEAKEEEIEEDKSIPLKRYTKK